MKLTYRNFAFRIIFRVLILYAFIYTFKMFYLGNSQESFSYRMRLSKREKNLEDFKRLDEERMSTMRRRSDRINRTCYGFRSFINRSLKLSQQMTRSNISAIYNTERLIARQQKLGWCKVPKVASTSLVESFLSILGKEYLITELGRSRQHTVLRNLMPHLQLGETDEYSREFLNIMVVRHPFARILSAYRDKISNKNDPESPAMFKKFLKKYNTFIIRKFRKEIPTNSFYNDVPTFPEFVEYLTNTATEEYNEHWRPYFQICSPCHINYKAVLKLETFQEDIEALVKITGFPQFRGKFTHKTSGRNVLENDFQNMHTLDLSDNYLEMLRKEERDSLVHFYSQITLKQVFMLFNAYRIDFEMFGYEVIPFYKIAKKKLYEIPT